MSSNKMATKSDLQEMYSRILPYLGGSADAGFTPIGTIIAVFSETAPANYLICDGATYNKADYPELAAHLLALTTHSQYEVSGDSTKFKVPDLRGEFLRGTGTNSHSGEGSGSNVGVHQDATQIPDYRIASIAKTMMQVNVNANLGDNWGAINQDANVNNRTGYLQQTVNKSGTASTGRYAYTPRPTNTSVLFCIATKNIYLNPQNDYSTDEKVVGTWIDGKPLYQCTTVITDLPSENMTQTQSAASNIDNVVDIKGVLVSKNGMVDPIPKIQDNSTTLNMGIDVLTSTGLIQLKARATTDVRQNWQKAYVTIQYTKTTS